MTNSLDPLVYIGINSFCVLSTLHIAAPCLSDKALLYTLAPTSLSVDFAFVTESHFLAQAALELMGHPTASAFQIL